MKGTRPKIDLPLTKRAKLLETAGFVLLILLWIVTIVLYISSPDIIPIHYNAHGIPNGYGSKAFLFLEAILGTVLYVLLTWLNRYPHVFNYLVEITEENARTQYTMATNMLRVLKLSILLFMLILLFQTSPLAFKYHLERYFLFFDIALVVATPVMIALYAAKMVKRK